MKPALKTALADLKVDVAALKQDRELLQSLLNSSGKAHFAYLDRDFNFVRVNQTYAATCGYRPDEMIGKNYFTLYPNSENEAIFQQVRDTGQAVEIHDKPFEFPNQPQRGVTYWDWTLNPARDTNGQIIGLILSLYETTSRVKAEELALQREDQLRTTLESIGDGFFTLDNQWRFVYLNVAAEQFIGTGREELLRKDFWDAFPPARGTEIEERFHLTANGEAQDWENYYEPWDRWYHNRCFPIKGGGISVYFREITGSKKLEEDLKKYNETLEESVRRRTEELATERKRLYDTLETLPVYVILLDRDYRVAFSNKFFRERFGESCGKRCYEFLFNKNAECEGCETYKVMKTKGPLNWEWTGPDGCIYDIYDFPFYEADGSMLILEMGIDVTRQKTAQDALRKQQEHLQRLNYELLKSNKELESFAFITSHDLQEPLRMVTSYTQLLAMKYKDQLDENANEYIDFAVGGAKRMYDLINDLLDYSKISRKEISNSKVDINEIIEIVKANLDLSIKEKHCTIDSTDLPIVYADKSQLIHLFQNLIANSIKFNIKNPHIIISAKIEESNYVFSVKDNGIGIESQYFEKIFEVFKRLNPRDKFEGTGIGLAICKKIVENYNGKIWIESEPGKGSVFYFTLPMHEPK